MSDKTKFAAFVAEHKLDARRIMSASHKLEALNILDRSIRAAKRRARKSETKTEKDTRKPHSGRPVTPRALNAANTGGTVSGPTKNRILKAVNYLLEQKKQAAVELKAIF